MRTWELPSTIRSTEVKAGVHYGTGEYIVILDIPDDGNSSDYYYTQRVTYGINIDTKELVDQRVYKSGGSMKEWQRGSYIIKETKDFDVVLNALIENCTIKENYEREETHQLYQKIIDFLTSQNISEESKRLRDSINWVDVEDYHYRE